MPLKTREDLTRKDLALVLLDEKPYWTPQAACAQAGQDVVEYFYSYLDHEIEFAKSICRRCPVQSECLELALVTKEDIGVWGGASEKERRKMWRRITTRTIKGWSAASYYRLSEVVGRFVEQRKVG